MKRKFWLCAALMTAIAMAGRTLPSAAGQLAKVGQAAPDFTASDSIGQRHHLSDYRGKFVVLEWHNNACAFTREHYESGDMQRLQKEWTAKGVIWLTVISSAPGKQGYVTPAQENDYLADWNAVPTAALLDPIGQLGHLYDAKTTPEMFVINPRGVLIYAGAMDNRGIANQVPKQAATKGAENYVAQALTEAMAGQAVKTPVTLPYGCPVKSGE